MIQMPTDFFEHLLNCLDNQKFIHVVNADGMSMGMKKVRKVQQDMQEAIDEANRQGRELLHNGVQPIWPKKVNRNGK